MKSADDFVLELILDLEIKIPAEIVRLEERKEDIKKKPGAVTLIQTQ